MVDESTVPDVALLHTSATAVAYDDEESFDVEAWARVAEDSEARAGSE